MIRILFVVLLVSLPMDFIYSQTESSNFHYRHQTKQYSRSAKIFSSFGIYLLAALPTIAIHETGHHLVAATMNPSSNEISFFPPNNKAYFERELKQSEQTAISLGGIVATRLTAEGVDIILNKYSVGKFGNRLGGGFYLTTRFDMLLHVLFSANWHWLGVLPNNQDDIYRGIIKPYFDDNQGLSYFSLIALMAIDIFFDRNEIKTNFNRLRGHTSRENNSTGLKTNLIYDNRLSTVVFHCKYYFN